MSSLSFLIEEHYYFQWSWESKSCFHIYLDTCTIKQNPYFISDSYINWKFFKSSYWCIDVNKLEQKKMLSVFIVGFISFYKSSKYLIFTGNRAERTPWCCKFVSFKILTEITASYNSYHSYIQCFSYDLLDMYTLLKLYQLLIRKKNRFTTPLYFECVDH